MTGSNDSQNEPYKSAIKRINELKVPPPGKLLDLSNWGLFRFPSEIGQLEKLDDLYISDNSINNLPPQIGQLKNLKILDISVNLIKKLPVEIGQLEALIILSANYNTLNELSSQFFKPFDLGWYFLQC
ncbi:MAG: hypothetical protein AAFN10_22135, partial [Bacteroidota bacterium]